MTVKKGRKENMKKFISVLLICLFALNINCGKFQKDIKIPRTKIQQIIDKKFPYHKNVVIAKLTFDSPLVYLKDKNIGMKLNFYGNFLKKEIKGNVDFNGQLSYRQEKGEFYLTNLDIVNISVNEVNFSNEDELKALSLKITKNFLDDYPVYSLKQTDFEENIAKLLIRNVKIEGEELIITMGI